MAAPLDPPDPIVTRAGGAWHRLAFGLGLMALIGSLGLGLLHAAGTDDGLPRVTLDRLRGAHAAHERGDLPGAIEEYRAAYRVDASDAQALRQLGYALDEVGDAIGAGRVYGRLVAMEGRPSDWARLARTHELSVRLEEALIAYERAASLDPGHFGARLGRANVLFRLGRLAYAEEAYRELLAAGPPDLDSAHAHNGLGAILVRRERYARAIEHFERAIELSPGLISARRNIEEAHDVRRRAEAQP